MAPVTRHLRDIVAGRMVVFAVGMSRRLMGFRDVRPIFRLLII